MLTAFRRYLTTPQTLSAEGQAVWMDVSISKKESTCYCSSVIWTSGLLERQSSTPRNQAKRSVLAQGLTILQRTYLHFIRESGSYLQQLELAEWESCIPPPQIMTDRIVHLLSHGSYLHQIFYQLHYSATQYYLTRLLITKSLLY